MPRARGIRGTLASLAAGCPDPGPSPVLPSPPGPTMTDTADFATVYARYLPPIRAKCRRLLGSAAAAEDVAQETFVRLWRSDVAPGAEARTVMAWLYRTCTRL